MSDTGGKEFLVVGLGGSAGAIPAFREFFRNVSPGSGMAYVVILHRSPDHDSRLAEALQGSTAIPVTQVRERVKVEPDHVYVIPPNQSLTINEGSLVLSPVAGFEECRAPVDIFFRTLGEAHDSRAVCVIVSGSGSDGSMGLRRIKEHSGLVLVQDPNEAEFDEMPRRSIATGMVDMVLPVADMPARIVAFRDKIRETPLNFDEQDEQDEALIDIFTNLRVRTGHDFSNYKRATVLRRIQRRIALHGLARLTEYAEYLRDRPDEAELLLRELLISVTNFFRDAKVWEAIEQRVVPKLLEGKEGEDHVRAWVVGCATGEEAYSVAMLLAEAVSGMASPPDVQIFATDLGQDAIAKARKGCYSEADVADVSPERLRRHFVREQEGYRVRRELRESILFAHHNLIKDLPFSHIDFVSCRNLLIHLNHTAQLRAMQVLHFGLEPGGWLLLGPAESSDGASQLFSAFDKESHIYQSRSVPRAINMPLPARQLAAEPRTSRFTSLDLHHQLIEEYAPPSLVLDEEHNIVHLSDRAGRYLQSVAGEASLNVLQVIRPDLRIALRSALFRAARKRDTVVLRDIVVRTDDRSELINLIVRPAFREGDPAISYFLVLFEESRDPASIEGTPPAEGEPAARQLEEEMIRVKLQMRGTVEQYEVQAEEAKAINEELHAINEELRLTTEELETSQEELQSLNEELQTVNQELKVKIDEIGHTNDDLRNLMSSTEIGTIFVDQSLRVKLFTPRVRDLFDLIPADVGRPLLDITTKLTSSVLDADLDAVLHRLQTIEREVESRDGRWYFMRLSPYRTAEDRIDGAVLTFLEITAQHRAQELLRETQKGQTYLLGLSDALRDLGDPAAIQATASRVLGEHLGLDRAYYAEIDEQAGEYVVARDWHKPDEPSHAGRYALESGPMPALIDGRTRSFTDVNTDPALSDDQRDACRRNGIAAAVIVPILQAGKPAGMFVAGQRRPRVWSEHEIALVQQTAERTSLAIDRARAEVALRASEERFRSVAESGLLAVAFFNAGGRITDANAAYLDLVGYTLDEVRRGEVRWDRLTPPEWLPRTQEAIDEYQRTGYIEPYEKEYFRKGGERFWGLFAGKRLETTGDGVALVVDISERKRREANLALIAELASTLAGAYDVSGVMHVAGEKLAHLLDIDRCYFVRIDETCDDVLVTAQWSAPGQNPLPLSMRISELPSEAGLEPADERRTFIRVPFQQSGDGKYVFSVISSKPRIWREDEIELVREMAHRLFPRLDRARAEEALRESEERHRAIVEEALDYAILTTDPNGVINGWSPGAESVFGWTAAEAIGQQFDITFTPEDRRNGVPEKERREAMERGHAPDVRWHLRKDGTRVFIDGTARALHDPYGKVHGFLKIGQDVTERRNTEEALRDSETRLKTVTNLVPDLLWSTDARGMSDWYNERWFEYTGQILEQACGYGWLETIHPEDREATRRSFERAVANGESLRIEHRMRDAAGEYRWFLVQGEPLRDADGQIVRWFGAATDIHEQRIAREQLEQRVRERTRELATLSVQRQRLLQRLVAATEEERRRIARELHDEMGQHLTALRVVLQTVQPTRDGVDHLKSIVDRLDQSVDRLTFELRPPALDHIGLHGAITVLAEEVSAASGLRVDVHLPGVEGERFGDGIETALYRVVQEALTNVWKHSGAKTASVIVEREGDALRMIVEDDGRGFDGDNALDDEPVRGRFGLLGMRERLALLGGAMHIESEPGSGTTIYVRVPLSGPPVQ